MKQQSAWAEITPPRTSKTASEVIAEVFGSLSAEHKAAVLEYANALSAAKRSEGTLSVAQCLSYRRSTLLLAVATVRAAQEDPYLREAYGLPSEPIVLKPIAERVPKHRGSPPSLAPSKAKASGE